MGMPLSTCAGEYACVHACVRVLVIKYVYVYAHVYVCVCMCMYIHVLIIVCIYVCANRWCLSTCIKVRYISMSSHSHKDYIHTDN